MGVNIDNPGSSAAQPTVVNTRSVIIFVTTTTCFSRHLQQNIDTASMNEPSHTPNRNDLTSKPVHTWAIGRGGSGKKGVGVLGAGVGGLGGGARERGGGGAKDGQVKFHVWKQTTTRSAFNATAPHVLSTAHSLSGLTYPFSLKRTGAPPPSPPPPPPPHFPASGAPSLFLPRSVVCR